MNSERTVVENPAVLLRTHITLVSSVHSNGEAVPALKLQFDAVRLTKEGPSEQLELPPVFLERAQVQELAEALQMALERLGGPMETQEAPSAQH